MLIVLIYYRILYSMCSLPTLVCPGYSVTLKKKIYVHINSFTFQFMIKINYAKKKESLVAIQKLTLFCNNLKKSVEKVVSSIICPIQYYCFKILCYSLIYEEKAYW